MDLVNQVFTTGALFLWQALLLYVYKELYAPRLPIRLLLFILLTLSIVIGIGIGI
ncbi:conserved within P. aerophilum [Pyrobaculum aerophilum str. IM2]|jgi:hypothetical protein|uniref:Conserved within P. aerophilum n=1 Tax=Pyrobaculum aerophilum (strain ATCC 51768 / DSM 7523 / JCM 9630 / CIP 104966 / NBRC 100827 / IM2) TaxID=178306 RepID=Q8ZZF6_PYRAE|nr:conserved within P. aerophilum [Pyrobaculum aerophilum str. IM2]